MDALEKVWQMKLWLIKQEVNINYDSFDSAVVAAETEEEARNIHPKESWGIRLHNEWDVMSWCKKEDVEIEYIGETDKPKGVILASFNAG